MYTTIDTVTSRKDKEDVDVKVTVKSRTRVSAWGKKNGTKVSGVFEDTTGKIDFVGWDGVTKYMDANLFEGKTVVIRKVRIKACQTSYTRTRKDVQLLFTNQTTVEPTEEGVLKCPVVITPLCDLAGLD
ncbi:uncharacterized protein LOC123537205 [Mercenaria mercenaria]|uniref:uncharacterized protein LOC123537205 n=1 Tax=Mercenaria mercenaria TaxID=6596 RepID=UPI00234EB1CF|nr:uncharacterized protein LOC123537205 [Mercenaria mercenaria]